MKYLLTAGVLLSLAVLNSGCYARRAPIAEAPEVGEYERVPYYRAPGYRPPVVGEREIGEREFGD